MDWSNGFKISDKTYSSSLIDVQEYIKLEYDGIFDILDPMRELNVIVDDKCNYLISNLYAIDVMTSLTYRLVMDYTKKLEDQSSLLKATETDYAS